MDHERFNQLSVPVPPYRGWKMPTATLTAMESLTQVREHPSLERMQAVALAEINAESAIDEEDARARERAIAEIAAVVNAAMQEKVILPGNQSVAVERNSAGNIVSTEKLEQIEKETDFRRASSWDDLRERIRAAGSITNTAGKTYSADQLLEQVKAAEAGMDLRLVTNAGNLRDTVEQLRAAPTLETNQPIPLGGPGQEAAQRARDEVLRRIAEQGQKQPAA